MLPVLDKKLFHSLGDCSTRTSGGETSEYQWILYDNNGAMEIIHWKKIEHCYGFLSYAFLNMEGMLLLSKTGGIMPFDGSRFFDRVESDLFYKACTINPDKRYGMYSKWSWFKVTGYDGEFVLPTSDFDLTKPNLIPLGYAFEKSDYRCKNYLFFLELSKGVHSYADENSQFFDYPISNVLSKSYHKTSDFVWYNKKIYKKEDVAVMDCWAYSKDDFDGIELLCILPQDRNDPMDNGIKYAFFENKDRVYEKESFGDRMETYAETVEKASKQEFKQQYPLTPDEFFKVDVLGTEMNAKMLNMDKPSIIPVIPNDWTKAQGNEYECDEDDSNIIPENSFPLPDDYIPEITCVKENKQLVYSLVELLELSSGEEIDTVIIDNSKRILDKQKDANLESDELALIQKESPDNIVILSNHIKYPFAVILNKYKYNDFCILKRDYKYNDTGELFRKNYTYVHFFSKELIPNHFGNCIIEYERLGVILSDMLFGERYLIINNQVLSEFLHTKFKIQLYTDKEYIDKVNNNSSTNEDTKLIVGKNGQRQFFE